MKLERPAYITDEYGVKWVVMPGDHCNKHLLALKAKGYTEQRLTRATLRGTMSTPPLPSAVDPRSVRLWECMEIINGA